MASLEGFWLGWGGGVKNKAESRGIRRQTRTRGYFRFPLRRGYLKCPGGEGGAKGIRTDKIERRLQVLVRALSIVYGRIPGQTRLNKQQPAQTQDSLAPISGTLKVWHGFRSGWIQQLARNLSPFSTCWLHFASSIRLSLHPSEAGHQSSGPASSLPVFSVRTSGP